MLQYYRDSQLGADRHQRYLKEAEEHRLAKANQPGRSSNFSVFSAVSRVINALANRLPRIEPGKQNPASLDGYQAGVGGANS